MKNVTFVIAAVFAPLMLGPGFAPGPAAAAHGNNDGLQAPSAAVVSDVPLASPDDRFASISPLYASGVPRMSGSGYFYAPGTGPRCEMTMKRVQGRLYQTCE